MAHVNLRRLLTRGCRAHIPVGRQCLPLTIDSGVPPAWRLVTDRPDSGMGLPVAGSLTAGSGLKSVHFGAQALP